MSTQEAALDRCFAVMHRDPWYYCTKEQGHEGLHANPTSATPPLVAASPVPPVVPDSDDEVQPLECAVCRHRATDHLIARGCMECDCELDPDEITRPWASGSGVVPDKPALALETAYLSCPCGRGDQQWCQAHGPNASVPAVTDDEAALAALVDARLATKTEMRSGFYQQVPRSNAEVAVAVLAVLRSAGFLIVHHTRNSDD